MVTLDMLNPDMTPEEVAEAQARLQRGKIKPPIQDSGPYQAKVLTQTLKPNSPVQSAGASGQWGRGASGTWEEPAAPVAPVAPAAPLAATPAAANPPGGRIPTESLGNGPVSTPPVAPVRESAPTDAAALARMIELDRQGKQGSVTGPAPAPAAAAPPSAPAAVPATSSVLPASTNARREALMARMEDAYKPQDYSALEGQMQQKGRDSDTLLRASILAGLGPSAVKSMQPHLLKEALAAGQPMKVEGGQISADGRTMLDPGFQQQRKVEALQKQLTALDSIDTKNMNQAMLDSYNQRRLDLDAEIRRAQININQQKVDQVGAKVNQPPASMVDKIGKFNTQESQLTSLLSNYQDEFSAARIPVGQEGNSLPTFTGGLKEWLSKNEVLGTSPNMANWWQGYNQWANVARNELFGSALTKQEADAFAKQNIDHNTPPQQARARLQQQIALVQMARNNIEQFYKKNPSGDHNDPRQVQAYMTGMQAPPPGNIVPAPGGLPAAAPGAAPAAPAPAAGPGQVPISAVVGGGGGGWTPEKERRLQELKVKLNAPQ